MNIAKLYEISKLISVSILIENPPPVCEIDMNPFKSLPRIHFKVEFR